MRIQLSLNIGDPQVIKVCQTLKETKELNSLVIRLLTAYTYDEKDLSGVYDEARSSCVEPEKKDYSDEYNSMRESLMMMDILLDDTKNLFDDSASTFSDYMEQAMEQDIYTKTETDTGTAKVVPKLLQELKKRRKNEENICAEKKKHYIDVDSTLEYLLKAVTVISKAVDIPDLDDIEIPEDIIYTDKSENEEPSSEYVFEPEGEEAEEEMEDFTEKHEPVTEIEDTEIELESGTTFEIEDDDSVAIESDEPVQGEASSAINDLLSSLM